MDSVVAPTCTPCGVKKQPWSLNNWKCPQCGAVGASCETQMEMLAQRVTALEALVVGLVQKRKRVA